MSAPIPGVLYTWDDQQQALVALGRPPIVSALYPAGDDGPDLFPDADDEGFLFPDGDD